MLLKYNIIEDATASYKHLEDTDWPTRGAFKAKSTTFENYITPQLIKSDLDKILASDKIKLIIKNKIIDEIDDYVAGADSNGLRELAKFATQYQRELSLDIIRKMAVKGIASKEIILLLQPHIESISTDQLFTILQTLKGDYPKLTEVGREKLRIPNTPANQALLQRLKQESIVSSSVEHESQIEIHRKYK